MRSRHLKAAGDPGVSPEPQASREHTMGTRLVARHTTSGGLHDHGQVSWKPSHKIDWKAWPRRPEQAGPQSRANTCGFAHRSLGSWVSGVFLALGVSSEHQPQTALFLRVSGQRGGGRGPVSILRASGTKLYNYLCPFRWTRKPNTHTHTHVHTQARTHTHMHTQACTHTGTRTHTHMHTQACTHTGTRTHTSTHVHTHAHIHACRCAHVHTHIHEHAHTQGHTHTYAHRHTQAHVHTQACTDTYAHTCAHRHTHTCRCTHTYTHPYTRI